jgi:hypothetical protein
MPQAVRVHTTAITIKSESGCQGESSAMIVFIYQLSQ